MATSSRQTAIFGANDWKAVYQTFSQADFQSYDYETLRKSFVDYLRTQYPETFNDYTESSEYIALLDVIAFMGQALAFRNDLNTRENFIDTAERRDSIIKLANLVGYNPKRNTPAQGYLKVTSVQTTENISDINGFNLAGIPVIWNDPANTNWQEQFNTVVNASLRGTQKIGRPGNRQTILGIDTQEYTIQIPTTAVPVIPFAAKVQSTNMNFEAVNVTSLGQEYIYEQSPNPAGKFNIIYRNDNLGYGSANTGFFLYFKQGTLQTFDFTMDQQIANQAVNIDIQGINETDTWLFKVDSTTLELSEWKQVESVYASAYSDYNTEDRKFFSVKSRFNDQVTYTFGDGVFGEIPLGNFKAFIRSSNALTYTIDPSEMQNVQISFTYVSKLGRNETMTMVLTLTSTISNAQSRETLEDIKLKAPTRYYTQNRMVNGEDYNVFPFTLYNSIIKSKALNRSSIGTSRNLDLLDPTGKYSSTSSFSHDGALYKVEKDDFSEFTVERGAGTLVAFLTNKILKVLSSNRAIQYYITNYPKYKVTFDRIIGGSPVVLKPKWKLTSYKGSKITGHFTVNNEPVPVGVFTSDNLKYFTTGAYVKFVPPAGYFFDEGRLVAGLATPSSKTHIWTTVLNVVDDGYNGGKGDLYNGLGPVTLNEHIPNGALLEEIIPAFDNMVPNDVIQSAIARVNIGQSFSLVFDNSLTSNVSRWFIRNFDSANAFVKFKSLGEGKYEVTNKALSYYFGSVKDTRFTYDRTKVIYDPLTGKLLYDMIKVLKANSLPNNNYSMAEDIALAVVGQTIETDGYPNDYSVEVCSFDPTSSRLLADPDFFTNITGYQVGVNNTDKFVFTRQIIDVNLLSKFELVASKDIVYAYPTENQIAVVKYEYPVGQMFYAYGENKFFKTVEDTTSANILLLAQVTNYKAYDGRQGLYFHYRHNSSNTTRINPATTNIIDLYLVTNSYYTRYQNWIKDSTGTIKEPSVPTIVELKQAYSKIDDYKMLSDTVVLNSVKFKPLFGDKAPSNLQATFKVIKNSNASASDSEIRIAVINEINAYFDIANWNFGDTFYFSELSAYLHRRLGTLISSIVLTPNDPNATFGTLYEIRSAPYEIFVNAAQATDVVVISALTQIN